MFVPNKAEVFNLAWKACFKTSESFICFLLLTLIFPMKSYLVFKLKINDLFVLMIEYMNLNNTLMPSLRNMNDKCIAMSNGKIQVAKELSMVCNNISKLKSNY